MTRHATISLPVIPEFILSNQSLNLLANEFGSISPTSTPGDFFFSNNHHLNNELGVRKALKQCGLPDINEKDESHVLVMKVILALAAAQLERLSCVAYPSKTWATDNQNNRLAVWIKADEILHSISQPICVDDYIQYEGILEVYLEKGIIENPYL